MKAISLTYQSHSDPTIGQPGQNLFDTGTEIRKDGLPIYDKNSLANAVNRIGALVYFDGISLAEAAKRVAEKDGYYLSKGAEVEEGIQV